MTNSSFAFKLKYDYKLSILVLPYFLYYLPRVQILQFYKKSAKFVLLTKVRSCYRVKPGGPKKFLLEVKTITKSPGNGIVESVKSGNLDKKGRIIWF